MHKPTSLLVLGFAAAAIVGCAHATPITPAPVSAQEAPKLQAAIVGTCLVTATQKEGGDKKDATGLSWTFGADGQASYNALGIVANFTYKLDGRNILMDGPFKAMRMEDWSGPTLKLFVYDLTQMYYCTKR